MAKKKTAEKAKIEVVPVLRAEEPGDDPTPETPVITKSYIMRDDWKDKDITNYVAFKSVDGEVETVLVNGEQAGGGDLTIAKVTLINSGGDDTAFYMYDGSPWIMDDELTAEGYQITTTGTIDLILYKGYAHISIDNWDDQTAPVITGSCTWDSEAYWFVITGDCSITLRGLSGQD